MTEETKETLRDQVKAMADGWDKSPRYIYQILAEEKDDFFAAFEAMYRGACKGGVATDQWDRKLAFIRESYSPTRSAANTADAFRDKFRGQNMLFERYIAAVADGKLTPEECRDLLDLISVERPIIDSLEKALIAHLARHEEA